MTTTIKFDKKDLDAIIKKHLESIGFKGTGEIKVNVSIETHERYNSTSAVFNDISIEASKT